MKNLILAMAIILSLLVNSGCCEKEYVYIEPDPIVLQTWEVNTTKRDPLKINYRVLSDE